MFPRNVAAPNAAQYGTVEIVTLDRTAGTYSLKETVAAYSDPRKPLVITAAQGIEGCAYTVTAKLSGAACVHTRTIAAAREALHAFLKIGDWARSAKEIEADRPFCRQAAAIRAAYKGK